MKIYVTAMAAAAAMPVATSAQCEYQWVPLGSLGGTQRVQAATTLDHNRGESLIIGRDSFGGGPYQWNENFWAELPGLCPSCGVTALLGFSEGGQSQLFAGVEGSNIYHFMARWTPQQGWHTVNASFNDDVLALTVFDSGNGPEVYAGGRFEEPGAGATRRVAKWNGTQWIYVGSPLSLTYNGPVWDLCAWDDGGGARLYAAIGAEVFRLEGSNWIAMGAPMSGTGQDAVYCLEVFDDGSGSALYAGGHFSQAGGVAANNIAKWSGLTWLPVDAVGITGGSAVVYAMAALQNIEERALYVGGYFLGAGTAAANNIAKWNGQAWSALGAGVNGAVEDMTVYDFGTGPAICAGGQFTAAGALPSNKVAAWRAVGNAPTISQHPVGGTVVEGSSLVLTVSAESGTVHYRWRKDGIELFDGGNVNGSFTNQLTISPVHFDDAGDYDVVCSNFCGSNISAAASIIVRPPCAGDVTGDWVVNVSDLLVVIAFWGPSPPNFPQVDINGDGAVNVNDLLAVINGWGEC